MIDEEKVILPGEKWSSEYAEKVVKMDFNAAEAYRTANVRFRIWSRGNSHLGWTIAWGRGIKGRAVLIQTVGAPNLK
jgi:hypothetical protein